MHMGETAATLRQQDMIIIFAGDYAHNLTAALVGWKACTISCLSVPGCMESALVIYTYRPRCLWIEAFWPFGVIIVFRVNTSDPT